MPKSIKNSFAGGELSTDLEGRTDLAKYATGAQLLENFFVTRFGGVSNRQGTEFTAVSLRSTTDTDRQARLMPFEFSVTQTYMLEFTDNIMRVLKDGSVVLSSRRDARSNWLTSAGGTDEWSLEAAAGGDYFINTGVTECWENGVQMANGTLGSLAAGEWAFGDNDTLGYDTLYVRLLVGGDPDTQPEDTVTSDYQLYTGIGKSIIPKMTFAQSADTLFLAEAGLAPSTITRTADDAWTFTALTFAPSASTPLDFYTALTGFTANDREVVYSVAAVNDQTIESLPSADIAVELDLNWPTAGRVDLFWNNITDGLESSSVFRWIVSASGTDEFYLELAGGGDPSISEPETVYEDKTAMVAGTAGSLAIGEWDYADNDTLGYSTVYCRIAAGADPDTKDVGYITYKVSTDEQWRVYKNYRGDWGWIGDVDKPWFLDDNVEPFVSIAPKDNKDPFNTGDPNDYPASVAIYEQRLFYSRTANNPQRVWASTVGDLTNFAISRPLSADDTFDVTLISGGRVDDVKHLLPLRNDLLVLTSGSEWSIGSGTASDSLTPYSVSFSNEGYEGASSTIPPLGISNRALFVQRDNQQLRAMGFNLDDGGYPSAQLNLLAQHLFETTTMVDWCYQQHPSNLVWMVMSDGTAVTMTYLPDQELIAFTRHSTNGKFKSCASITEDDSDDVYFIVERTVDGVIKEFIEKLSSREFGSDVKKARFLDSSLTYNPELVITDVAVTATETTVTTSTAHGYSNGDFCYIQDVIGVTSTEASDEYNTFNYKYYTVANVGASTFEIESLDDEALTTVEFTEDYISGGVVRKCTKSVSGLGHLEGETVSVLADGQALGDHVVTSGAITLGTEDPGYGLVHVGLSYNCDIQTLRFDLAVGGTTVQWSKKNIAKMIMRFKDSSGGLAGPDVAHLTPIKWRQAEYWQQPNDLKTEDVEHSIARTWDREGRVYFRQSDPLPTTMLALIMEYNLGDK